MNRDRVIADLQELIAELPTVQYIGDSTNSRIISTLRMALSELTPPDHGNNWWKIEQLLIDLKKAGASIEPGSNLALLIDDSHHAISVYRATVNVPSCYREAMYQLSAILSRLDSISGVNTRIDYDEGNQHVTGSLASNYRRRKITITIEVDGDAQQ